MIKKAYIQPKVKEVKVILPTILAGSIVNPDTKYSMDEDGPIDPDDPAPVDAGDGL